MLGRAICLAGLFAAFATTLPALAQSRPPNLSGWWIAIDDSLKQLWDDGTIVPMEELLLIDQMRFENRMMGFWSVDPETCRQGYTCSDAPLVAIGRLSLDGGTLSLDDTRTTGDRIDHARTDPLIRARAVSATRSWRVTKLDLTEGVLALRGGPGDRARTFYRVEPERLRRLRAGLMAAEQSASGHWRCWIAAATGAMGQSSGFRPGAQLSPQIADYIRIASYQQTATAQYVRPLPDDPDPARRKLAETRVEALMDERFDTLPSPRTAAEQLRPALVARYLALLTAGQTRDAAKAALAGRSPQFEPPQDISAGEAAAIGLARLDTPEAKRLFCKEQETRR